MKKIKKISFILIVLISIIGITYKGIITAYAEKYAMNTVELNKVYNKGDVLTIYNLEDVYMSSYYPEEAEELYIINYQDKNGNDMYIYVAGMAGSGMFAFPSITIGASFEDNLRNTYLEAYNIMKDEIEITEEEFKTGMEENILSIAEYSLLYDNPNNDIQQIEKWQVVESTHKTFFELCKNNSNATSNGECEYILEYYEESTSGSGAYISDFFQKIMDTPVITFKEYEEPEFVFECSPTTIKYQEKTNCNLKINTTDKIVEIKTNLNSSELELNDINVKDGWTITEDENGYYVLKNEEGFSGEDTILLTTLTAKENKNTAHEVSLNNFTYTTATGQTKTIDLPTNVQVESVEDNPDTSDARLIIIILLLTISGYFIVKIYQQKKVLSE